MTTDGDRTRHWPAIEKKHGEPMQCWFDQVADMTAARIVPRALLHVRLPGAHSLGLCTVLDCYVPRLGERRLVIPRMRMVIGGVARALVARRAEPGAWQRLGLVFDPPAPCDLSPS